jgi:N-acetylmuramoyl-L-alanine amidase
MIKIATMTTLITAVSVFALPGRPPTSELDLVAAVIAGEARGEGRAGMRAVAEVIRNRGTDHARTVLAPYQFSCLNDSPGRELVRRMKNSPMWATAWSIALQLYLHPEDLGDATQGATHYHAEGITPPNWAVKKRRTTQIGKHIFYRL